MHRLVVTLLKIPVSLGFPFFGLRVVTRGYFGFVDPGGLLSPKPPTECPTGQPPRSSGPEFSSSLFVALGLGRHQLPAPLVRLNF